MGRKLCIIATLLDLRAQPKIADQEYLDGGLESEGRSHAFNYIAEPDGSGVFGLPTVFKGASNWRYWTRTSDVHFFKVAADLDILPAGYLAAANDAGNADYACEVSCIDWYGNARPIFYRNRVFALTGSEIIEGHIQSGQIVELGRVNMTGIPLHPRLVR